MLRDLLEIFVITYNRADRLERTLAALAESPFAGCRVTVQDNASTDATPDVCARFGDRFEDLHVVRHEVNIGGSANYLRAVETSTAEYTWVLADDDVFEFEHSPPVIEAIESRRFDALFVSTTEGVAGRPDPPDARAVETTTRAYLRGGDRRFWGFTFLPAVIFRTALYDSPLMVAAYRNCANWYPQFPFAVRMAERELPLFAAARSVVRRQGQNDTVPSWLDWWTIWTASCDTIDEKWLRHEAVRQAADPGLPFAKALAVPTIMERIAHPERAAPQLWRMLGRRVSWSQRAAILLALPLAYVPPRAYRLAQAILRPRQPREEAIPISEYDDLRR